MASGRRRSPRFRASRTSEAPFLPGSVCEPAGMSGGFLFGRMRRAYRTETVMQPDSVMPGTLGVVLLVQKVSLPWNPLFGV